MPLVGLIEICCLSLSVIVILPPPLFRLMVFPIWLNVCSSLVALLSARLIVPPLLREILPLVGLIEICCLSLSVIVTLPPPLFRLMVFPNWLNVCSSLVALLSARLIVPPLVREILPLVGLMLIVWISFDAELSGSAIENWIGFCPPRKICWMFPVVRIESVSRLLPETLA